MGLNPSCVLFLTETIIVMIRFFLGHRRYDLSFTACNMEAIHSYIFITVWPKSHLITIQYVSDTIVYSGILTSNDT